MKFTSFTAVSLNPQLITFEITDLVVGLTCNLKGRGVSCERSKKGTFKEVQEERKIML